jgi:hypothetical protein
MESPGDSETQGRLIQYIPKREWENLNLSQEVYAERDGK